MRTLFEIIEAAKSNEPTTHEECLYALLAVECLRGFHHADLMALVEKEGAPVMARVEDAWRRNKDAMKSDPQVWLGWENNPKNPAYQELRNRALQFLFSRVAGAIAEER